MIKSVIIIHNFGMEQYFWTNGMWFGESREITPDELYELIGRLVVEAGMEVRKRDDILVVF